MRRTQSSGTRTIHVRMQSADAERVRELAAALGYTISRGAGAGMGNIAELLVALEEAYQRDPNGVQKGLKGILKQF